MATKEKPSSTPTARKPEVKRGYIDTVYEILVDEGIEGVSAREIARRMGKSATTTYRHFPNLNYLIGLASVRFLKPYIDLLSKLVPDAPNPLDLSLQTWEAFAYYAFRNIPVFENLFFGDSCGGKLIEDYFGYFPEERSQLTKYIETIADSTDLVERTRFLHRRSADEGYIAEEDVEYLVNVDVLTLRGLFQEYRNSYTDESAAREAVSRFVMVLYRTYTRALLPGKTLIDSTNRRYAHIFSLDDS